MNASKNSGPQVSAPGLTVPPGAPASSMTEATARATDAQVKCSRTRADGGGTGRSAHRVGDGFAQGGYEGVRELRGRRAVGDQPGRVMMTSSVPPRVRIAMSAGLLREVGLRGYGRVDEHVPERR